MAHPHHTHNGHDAALRHDHAHGAGLAEILTLDAEILGAYITEATQWIAANLEGDAALIVDIGAGTGAGSIALAEQFGSASVLAVDASDDMLEQLRNAATASGVEDRVRTVRHDLDTSWPEDAAAADVVWASSSLHELADPDRILRDAYAALRPGGVLAVIEMDELHSFLPTEFPAAAPGIEARFHAALADQGWNAHPDWQANIEGAGFERVERRRFPGVARSANAARFARAWFRNVRTALAGSLSDADLATLDELITDAAALPRVVHTVSGSRTAWLARRPVQLVEGAIA